MNIQKEWEKFQDTVVGREASLLQRAEMRMAFIAGMTIFAKRLEQSEQTTDDFNSMSSSVERASRKYMEQSSVEIYKEEMR